MASRVTRRINRAAALAASLSAAAALGAGAASGAESFGTVANWNVPGAGLAEIVAATPDGRTLLYTDAANRHVGLVDISDPAAPAQLATIPVDGEPTSVAISESGARAFIAVRTLDREEGEAPTITPGELVVVDIAARARVATVPIGDGPDSVSVTRVLGMDVAVVAIENEPLVTTDGTAAGEVTDVESPGDPNDISGPGRIQVVAFEPGGARVIDLPLVGHPDEPAGLLFADDPQPEFVSIRGRRAAVSLQENNGVVVFDVRDAVEAANPTQVRNSVETYFELGRAGDRPADLADDDTVAFGDVYPGDVDPGDNPDPGVRNPDAVAWSPDGTTLYTADEGEADFSGGRGWSAWNATTGDPEWEDLSLERIAARFGHYPDSRSDAKGIEIEGLATGVYGGHEYAFVGSERGSFVAVYDIADPRDPVFVQLLPTGIEPEGVLPIPQRDLLVASAEATGDLVILRGRDVAPGGTLARPQISAPDASQAWAALSGLAADPADAAVLWGVPDNALPSALYRIEVAGRRAALALTPIRKEGVQARYDLEGIAVDTSIAAPAAGRGFWLASEGNAAFGAPGYAANMLVQVDADGNVLREVVLPEAVDSPTGGAIRSNGFEGVTVSDSGRYLLAAVQRDYASDDTLSGLRHTRIARYDLLAERWDFFLYPLDPTAVAGDWVGLSEIVNLGGDRYAVIERDKLQGGAARLKAVYEFTLDGLVPTDGSPLTSATDVTDRVIAKTLLRDVADQTAPFEKLEGLAVTREGDLWTAVDNDGGLHESRIARAGAVPPAVDLWLSLLHNNDGESKLVGGPVEGGAARFASVVRALRAGADERGGAGEDAASILVSSGDNFLAGPEFNASLARGTVPYFDSILLNSLRYDALTIGNHEFDFGPQVLADVIEGTPDTGPWISSNLDVSAEPALASLRGRGRIAPSAVLTVRGRKVGVVGATTPLLPLISSPGLVTASAVAPAVQAEIDRLRAAGVDIIIVSSHLQSIGEDTALVPFLRGADIVIAGGGGELLANDDDLLQPADAALAAGARPYPVVARDADGREVPVVTTSGNLRYVGRLIAGFDADGEIVRIADESGPVRVVGAPLPDGVAADPFIQDEVVAPVQASIAALAANRIADTEVPLDGRRPIVRNQETNLGNLVADAMLFAGRRVAGDAGLAAPVIAFHNAGGIRNDNVFPAVLADGVTELNTFSVLPFSNFVAVIPSLSRADLKATLEHSVARVGLGDGRFLQVSGMRVEFDPNAPAGERIVRVVLDDGTEVIGNKAVRPGPALVAVTTDFTARGGDGFAALAELEFFRSPVFAQAALRDYIQAPAAEGGLGGTVTAAAYPAVAVPGGARLVATPDYVVVDEGPADPDPVDPGPDPVVPPVVPPVTPPAAQPPVTPPAGGGAGTPSPVTPPTAGPGTPAPTPRALTRVRFTPRYAVVARGRGVGVRVRVVAPRALAGRPAIIERRVGTRSVLVRRVRIARSGAVNTVLPAVRGRAVSLRVRVLATPTTRAFTSGYRLVRVPAARG